MFGITSEQFTSAFRWVLSIGTGYLVGKGFLTETDAGTLAAAVLAIGTLAWGVYTRRGSKVADSKTGVAKAPTIEQKQNLMSAGADLGKVQQIKNSV